MRRKPSLLLAAFLLTGLGWATVRITVEQGIEAATERGLHTIVDLVASNVVATSAGSSLRGAALAEVVAGSGTDLAQALQRAGSEHLRTVYFFDASGRVVLPGKAGIAAGAVAPEIVRLATQQRQSEVPMDSGLLSEPYSDVRGDAVVGAWRWLPAADIGIVAERPYAGFARPLRWIDGVFLALVALLVLGALVAGGPPLREVLAAFRRSDVRRCGPYVIDRLVGEGAMANVYLARHRQLGRSVALKLLKGGKETDELVARFVREAKLASQLVHPNIVTIFDYGRAPEGGFFYAMEFIHGLTVPQWVQEHGPVLPARTVRVLQQVCAAIGAMHAAGFLHRDVKPDNVMVYASHDDFDLAKLIDFGLAKDVDATGSRDLTRNLRVLGTPAYMAPERLSDPRSVDPRTDLYGIGCIAFYLLTGRKPFEATRDADLAQQVLHVAAPRVASLSPFAIPERLDALVAALLAKTTAERPATAAALATELDAIARLVPWRRELARLWWRSSFPAFADNASADHAAKAQPATS